MISIENDLELPDSLRDELKKPFGEVLECYEVLKRLKNEQRELITVGDSVSSFFIRQGAEPNLIIWDSKTKRQPIDESSKDVLSDYAETKTVKNPPGRLTKEAWEAVSSSLGAKKASVQVMGEEDLLTIPAILNAKEGSYVVYGHPPGLGAILIVVDRKIKALFEGLVSKFEKSQ